MLRCFNPRDKIERGACVFVVGNPLQSIAPPSAVKKQLSLGYSQTADAYAWEAQASFDDDASADAFEDPVEGLRTDRTAGANPVERYAFAPANAAVIRGDGSRERIFIEALDLEGELSYLLLPEYTDEAYQLANSGGWVASRLVPGRVQVIAGGTYRGAYYMQLPAPGDTLHIPLGQDVRVRANRERVLDRCTSTVFGGRARPHSRLKSPWKTSTIAPFRWRCKMPSLSRRAVTSR